MPPLSLGALAFTSLVVSLQTHAGPVLIVVIIVVHLSLDAPAFVASIITGACGKYRYLKKKHYIMY
jgi:hypothetical protein